MGATSQRTEGRLERTPPRIDRLLLVAAVTVLVDAVSKSLAFAIAEDASVLVAPSTNRDLMLGLLDPDRSVALTVALAIACVGVLAHAIVLWRRQRLPTVVVGIGLGSIVANALDRTATGTVHDWLKLGSIAANLADLGVLLFVIVYATQAMRSMP